MATFRYNVKDNKIILRDGALEYIDTIENAAADSGQTFAALPSDVVAFYYNTTKGFAKYSDGSSERPAPYPVASVEAALASLAVMIDAKAGRDNPPPTLADKRKSKLAEIKAHAAGLMAARIPALGSMEIVGLVAELWPMLDTAQASADLQAVRNIYIYGKNKVTQLASASEAEVDAYDPTADPSWPV